MIHDLLVVGAGPIGLATATHARRRGLSTLILEAGATVGAAVAAWGHVRLFSPWSELVDPVAEKLLADTGWTRPDAEHCPTGAEWVSGYLQPLAYALTASEEVELRLGHRVVGVARRGRDRLVDAERADVPFTVLAETSAGPARLYARTVVDASGTWGRPSPLGGDGLAALGEVEHRERISYRIPDLTDPAVRQRYAGRRVAVAGTGASAQNVLVDLAALATEAPGTEVVWLVRRGEVTLGDGDDELAARGALARRAATVAASPGVETVTGFRTEQVTAAPAGRIGLVAVDGSRVEVDEVIAVTGFRPDLDWLSEVRLDLDPVLSAPTALAPMIDPNVHSCGTVEPHGADVLAQPEAGLYLAGMKSYGRAPSFLALTGFEQVRSVVAAIAGDHDEAARVGLTLPETGVCGGLTPRA